MLATHYLKKDLGTQRETIARALSLYLPESGKVDNTGVTDQNHPSYVQSDARLAEKKQTARQQKTGSLNPQSGIRISKKDADRMLKWYWMAEMQKAHSGTNSGTIGNDVVANHCDQKTYGELAERQGACAGNCDSLENIDNAELASSDIWDISDVKDIFDGILVQLMKLERKQKSSG